MMKQQYISMTKTLVWLFMGIISIAPMNAAYPNSSLSQAGDVKATINTLLHYSNNHEQELREIDEKFKNMEAIVDSLQRDTRSQSSKQKDAAKSLISPIASKVSNLEVENTQLKTELHEIKLRLNEYIQHFAQYKHHLDELHKQQKVQSENIELLHSSMKDLIDALQATNIGSNPLYKVKSGDSLEKIASIHKTSVKAIKELNNLTGDRIIIGQELKLP